MSTHKFITPANLVIAATVTALAQTRGGMTLTDEFIGEAYFNADERAHAGAMRDVLREALSNSTDFVARVSRCEVAGHKYVGTADAENGCEDLECSHCGHTLHVWMN